MKKIIGLLTVAVLICCTTVIAQPPGGGQQMSPEQRTAMMKERLKPAGLTDVQADSVVAVFTDRSLRGNMRDMTPEERQAKMKEVNEAMAKRLEKSIGAELTKKVMEIMSQRGPWGGGKGGER